MNGLTTLLGNPVTIILLAVLLIALFYVLRFFRVAQEYERAVVFSLGRVGRRPRGPGLYLVLPWERAQKVDIRTITLLVQPQDCITSDNVTIKVDAVAYFKVLDPTAALVNVRDFMQATLQISQTSLRSVIGQAELDQLLAHRDTINQHLRQIIGEQTEHWGIQVSVVEIKDIELPQTMQRAMARQAEAEREKRAKIIHAEGEFQAAQQLHDAAVVIAQTPAALQLRYLQTLTEIAVEKNSTIIFPMPIDLIQVFTQMADVARLQKTPTQPPDNPTTSGMNTD